MIKIQIKFMEFQYNYFYSFGALLNFGKNSNLHISSSKKVLQHAEVILRKHLPQKARKIWKTKSKVIEMINMAEPANSKRI